MERYNKSLYCKSVSNLVLVVSVLSDFFTLMLLVLDGGRIILL